MVNTIRNKKGLLGANGDYNKRKSDFLKEIIKNITSKRRLFKRIKKKNLYNK